MYPYTYPMPVTKVQRGRRPRLLFDQARPILDELKVNETQTFNGRIYPLVTSVRSIKDILSVFTCAKRGKKAPKKCAKQSKNVQNMSFATIPTDLQNLICDFAWKTNVGTVCRRLDAVLTLKTYRLPANFYHALVWSWIEMKFVNNPLVEFSPLGDFSSFFNQPLIRQILYTLDFRKRHVKMLGTRWNWLTSFDEHWSNIVQFGIFYSILKKTRHNIHTPTYTEELRNSGSRFWSSGFPFELL